MHSETVEARIIEIREERVHGSTFRHGIFVVFSGSAYLR
jgi:hypothetical protein